MHRSPHLGGPRAAAAQAGAHAMHELMGRLATPRNLALALSAHAHNANRMQRTPAAWQAAGGTAVAGWGGKRAGGQGIFLTSLFLSAMFVFLPLMQCCTSFHPGPHHRPPHPGPPGSSSTGALRAEAPQGGRSAVLQAGGGRPGLAGGAAPACTARQRRGQR